MFSRSLTGQVTLALIRLSPPMVAPVLALALATGMATSARAGETGRHYLHAAETGWAEACKTALPPPPEPEASSDATTFQEPYFPFLPGEDPKQSVSVGTTSDGYLVNAVAFSESPARKILPRQKKRTLPYGSAPLVRLLEETADVLFAEHHTPLWLGNVGRRGGGDIRWSVSHNSGRDADVAFAYMNSKGEPVDPPDLIPLGGLGMAKVGDLRFDVVRTWTIVSTLIASKHAQVQYLFIASDLREMLLKHARDQKVPLALLQRAALVMHQPAGSAPHNDHLHVRIFCSKTDVEGGCVNTGAIHEGVPEHLAGLADRRQGVRGLLGHGDADVRKRALDRLIVLNDTAAPYQDYLADPAVQVRIAAANALGAIRPSGAGKSLAARFDVETDSAGKVALIMAAGEVKDRAAGKMLRVAVGTPSYPSVDSELPRLVATTMGGPAWLGLVPATADATRDWLQLSALWPGSTDRSITMAALSAARRAERLEPAPALVALLRDRSPEVRHAAGMALRYSTNFGYAVDWRTGTPEKLAWGYDRWNEAYERSKTAAREAWVITGFQQLGYTIKRVGPKASWELVRATVGLNHIGYNARRLLEKIYAHPTPKSNWSKRDNCLYWYKFIKRRHRKFHVKKPPKGLQQQCFRSPQHDPPD